MFLCVGKFNIQAVIITELKRGHERVHCFTEKQDFNAESASYNVAKRNTVPRLITLIKQMKLALNDLGTDLN